jgi:sigma-B regulation protein RsbU (phosphoserine phosphatase)
MTDAATAAAAASATHASDAPGAPARRRRTLRRHILWLVAGLNIVSTVVACTVAYKFQKEAFLHGLDKLLVAGAMSAEDFFGTEYHDRLQRAEQITPAEEMQYVERISELAKRLNLHYIGALVRREGNYFYSITSSPDKKLADGTYDHIWTQYVDATPALVATFEDGHTRFEEHADAYGSFRSAYVPFKRVGDDSVYYVYVADVDLSYVYAELAETLWKTALAGMVICAGSIVCCWVLASYAAGPMTRLAGVIRTVVSRDFAMEAEQQTVLARVASRSVEEVANVADAFRRMQERLCAYLQELQESTAARQRIESDLRIAHEIQMGLLPCHLPEVDGCELFARVIPAKEVGGDLFDAAVMPDGRLNLVVADVSGKGVPAGLFMAVAKTLLNVGRKYCQRPDELVAFLNQELAAHNDSLMFVTLYLAMFDPRTGELQYTNAGHNPPFVRRADGKVEMLEGKHGMALGISPTAEFTTETVRLGDGDLLMLYTDGVSEAQNEASELFDERRLAECLTDLQQVSASVAGTELLGRVMAFQGTAPQFDDITLLSLCYTAAKPAMADRPATSLSPAGAPGA